MRTLFSMTVLLWLLTGCASEDRANVDQKTRISRAEAERIALSRAVNGTIKDGELEKEKGRLIWSFDIATPESKNITEVQVDAQTGQVVAVEQETPRR